MSPLSVEITEFTEISLSNLLPNHDVINYILGRL